MTKVDDAASGPFYNGAFHFVDGSDATTEYTYDQNGNMTKDLNKNISSITYNLLNLPSNINYSNGRSATYVYGADGKKLRVSYLVSNPSTSTTVDYCGNLIYENNVLKQILVDGGYITFSGSTPQYHFYLKDHLGNNRVVASANGTVEQVNHYYPYGGLFGESTNGDHQRFKYNGKELDRMNGLDWLDYGARHMDAARGLWPAMDPMAEKYYSISPYAYCAGNPVNAIDLHGSDIWELDKYGNIINYTETNEYDMIRMFNSNPQNDISLKFGYGTIEHQTKEGKDGSHYELFRINGDDNGRSVFEMLAQNTDVEWSLGQFDESSGNPNVLTTSHSDYSESGMNSYLYNNPSLVMSLKNRIHNHPNSNPDPSFTSRNGSTGGDMEVIHHYDKFYPNNQINYSIYTLYAGSWGYYSYDRNTKADAIRGRQTELPDVFVSGKNKKKR